MIGPPPSNKIMRLVPSGSVAPPPLVNRSSPDMLGIREIRTEGSKHGFFCQEIRYMVLCL